MAAGKAPPEVQEAWLLGDGALLGGKELDDDSCDASESEDSRTSVEYLQPHVPLRGYCRRRCCRSNAVQQRNELGHGVLVLLTLAVGVGMLIVHEGLTTLEAVYVITQVITTIGYGDITVSSDFMRVFMAFYVLWDLVLVAYFLNTVVQNMLESHSDQLKDRLVDFERRAEQTKMRRRLPEGASSDEELSQKLRDQAEVTVDRKYAEVNMVIYTGFVFLCFVGFGTFFFHFYEGCSCSYGTTGIEGCTTENACEVGQRKSLSSAFYMSVITLTTVGFGDFTPVTQGGRVASVLWMLFGIVSTALFLDALQTVFLKLEVQKKFDDAEAMSEEIFRQADRDGQGSLSRAEFVNYVLVRHGLVDQDTLDRIYGIYDKMDRDRSESVTFDEVQRFQQEVKATQALSASRRPPSA